MPRPPVVYLDTQDYSRFGDVLRGKSDASTEAIFHDLESKKRAGEVIFAISAPILNELLKYNPKAREITKKKAEAVELLCRKWALAFPSRLIASEIADAAKQRGLLPKAQDTSILASNWYWHPNVASSFEDFAERWEDMRQQTLKELPLSRTQRRLIQKRAKKTDFGGSTRLAALEVAAMYGLPAEPIVSLFAQLLKKKISAAEASSKLFGFIAGPIKFIDFYFEGFATDPAVLNWISDIGKDVQTSFAELREHYRPLMKIDEFHLRLRSWINEQESSFGSKILNLAMADIEEFGVTQTLFESLSEDISFAAEVPACTIISRAYLAYLAQIMGVMGTEGKIEISFGGDLLHTLYLSHVDLWRSDKRFSHLLKKAIPQYAARIVGDLKDLPSAIDGLTKAGEH